MREREAIIIIEAPLLFCKEDRQIENYMMLDQEKMMYILHSILLE